MPISYLSKPFSSITSCRRITLSPPSPSLTRGPTGTPPSLSCGLTSNSFSPPSGLSINSFSLSSGLTSSAFCSSRNFFHLAFFFYIIYIYFFLCYSQDRPQGPGPRSRSRSLSPINDTDSRFYYTGDMCKECNRLERVIDGQAQGIRTLSKLVMEQKQIITKQANRIKQLEAEHKQIDDTSIHQVLCVLEKLDSKVGIVLMLPWKDTFAVNVMYVLYLCRVLYDKSWYLKKLTKILKDVLQCRSCSKYEKRLLKIAPVSKSNTMLFMPVDTFRCELAKLPKVRPHEKMSIVKAMKKVAQKIPKTVKLCYEATATKMAVGTPVTPSQLKSLYAIHQVRTAFVEFDGPERHFCWSINGLIQLKTSSAPS